MTENIGIKSANAIEGNACIKLLLIVKLPKVISNHYTKCKVIAVCGQQDDHFSTVLIVSQILLSALQSIMGWL